MGFLDGFSGASLGRKRFFNGWTFRFSMLSLLNVAYWGRQFQFGVRGYNPARERPEAPELGVLASARHGARG